MTEALCALAGALAGFAVAWFLRKSREAAALAAEREARVRAEVENEQLRKAGAGLEQSFKALAHDALLSNNQAFLGLAQQTLEKHLAGATKDLELRKREVEEIVKPIHEGLRAYHEKAELMERERQTAYGGLSKLLDLVRATQEGLKQETVNLVSALKQPNVRGRWGEITLRRVAELAGMSPHCDFTEQQTVEGEEGQLRPDLVVHLPNSREIVVDAKAVLSGYLDALEATTDEARSSSLARHAAHLRDRVKTLSGKRYWESFEKSADFVVLFVPGEPFLAAAVQHDPNLMEEALASRVVIATPTTLVALLKAVAYGWRQEQMAENAREVAELGRKLYESIATWTGHVQKLRDSIFNSVEHFNAAQASLDRNVLSRARKMKELGVSSEKELPPVDPIDKLLRPVEPPQPKA